VHRSDDLDLHVNRVTRIPSAEIITTGHKAAPERTRCYFYLKVIGYAAPARAFHQKHGNAEVIDRLVTKESGREAAVQVNPDVVSGFNRQTGRAELANEGKALLDTQCQHNDLRLQNVFTSIDEPRAPNSAEGSPIRIQLCAPEACQELDAIARQVRNVADGAPTPTKSIDCKWSRTYPVGWEPACQPAANARLKFSTGIGNGVGDPELRFDQGETAIEVLDGVRETGQKLYWRPWCRSPPKAELAAEVGGGFLEKREPRHVHVAYMSKQIQAARIGHYNSWPEPRTNGGEVGRCGEPNGASQKKNSRPQAPFWCCAVLFFVRR